VKFKDRNHAGKLLAEKMEKFRGSKDVILLAIPRGGVPIAYNVAEELNLKFSLIVTKKLAPPSNPEFGFGAIAPDGTYIINKHALLYQSITDKELNRIKENTLEQVKERINNYQIINDIDYKDKIVVIIDDGIATGYTAMVAGKYIKKKGAYSTILAIPVAPFESIEKAKAIFDEIICVESIESFSFAVGYYYDDFHQVSDEELHDYISKAQQKNLLFKETKKPTESPNLLTQEA